MTDVTEVAVGIILNNNNVLISRRPENVHQGNCWEFPGGKVEQHESITQALKRELKEELDIDCQSVRSLSRIHFDYGDKTVLLHNYIVDGFSGIPKGLEGQPVQWVSLQNLTDYRFPEANQIIINQLQLPDYVQITGSFSSLDELKQQVVTCIDKKVQLIHFRAHQLDDVTYMQYAKEILQLCNDAGVRLVLNRDVETFEQVEADGLHITSARLKTLEKRPVTYDKLFSVSCHDETELKQAENLQPDYVFLSPYKSARSHQSGAPLGDDKFSRLTRQSSCPVFALGGTNHTDISVIKSLGGRGVAAVSEYWTIA